jgi:hypothetical protein
MTGRLREFAQWFATGVCVGAAASTLVFAWFGQVTAAGATGAVCVGAGIVTAIVRRPGGGAA